MDGLKEHPLKALFLRREHWEQMRSDVSMRAPEEACGLVGGRDNHALGVIPITNELHSPVRFRMKPSEQLRALLNLDERGWELVAIYHSHPHGPVSPSPMDIAEAFYPDVIHLIWFQSGEGWDCQGYCIQKMQVVEAPVYLDKDQIEQGE